MRKVEAHHVHTGLHHGPDGVCIRRARPNSCHDLGLLGDDTLLQCSDRVRTGTQRAQQSTTRSNLTSCRASGFTVDLYAPGVGGEDTVLKITSRHVTSAGVVLALIPAGRPCASYKKCCLAVTLRWCTCVTCPAHAQASMTSWWHSHSHMACLH